MPFKSEAQRRWMHAAAARGEIKPGVVDEFDKASTGLKLPERLRPSGTRAPRRRRSVTDYLDGK